MPVPKRKRSRTRRDKRFANKGMKVKAITQCGNCQSPTAPHIVCQTCGHYKGIKVVVSKLERAIKRAQTRKVMRPQGDAVLAPQESPAQEA